MPIINVELGLGQVNEKQKKQMIERFTADAVDITGMGIEKFTVLINELPLENIGVAGKPVKEFLAAAKA